MDTAETLYGYFYKALKHSVNERGRGAQKAIAIDAGISPPSLSQILSDTSRKRASLKTQVELAKAFDYQYEDFLALGRKLLAKETPDNQKRDSTANPMKEVPKKDRKVGKNMDVEEWKELLQHYKAMLERNDADMSALRKDNEYLRERVRELETAKRETDVKASEPAKPEKKTAV